MNVYDSMRMLDVLVPLGYREVRTPEEANLVILNTCHIREKASEKLFSALGQLRKLKQHNTTIAVAGCVAQAEGEEIISRCPFVDIVFGPQTYHRLPQLLQQAQISAVVETSFPQESKFQSLPDPHNTHCSAFLTVQEGCDKFCTFCVVPYTRGVEVSRPVKDILAEAQKLTQQGVQELTLLGQNVNAYHGLATDQSHYSLAQLLTQLSQIHNVKRLRYTTSHPNDMSPDLIQAHKNIPKLMPALHLPVQSGSPRILQAMNRRHHPDDYRRIVDHIRHARPDIALSSDFIVGFPSETDHDFQQTLQLVQEISYAHAYAFKYSPRLGTPAAKRTDQIPQDVKNERLHQLQTLLKQQQITFNRTHIGQKLHVLFDRHGKKKNQWLGRTQYMQVVQVESQHLPLLGQLLEVHIVQAEENSLFGQLVHPNIPITIQKTQHSYPSLLT